MALVETMTLTHVILRWAHISMGLVGILSGAAALTLRKGSRPHQLAGHVFFVSMLIMASMGATLAMTYSPNRGNVMGGAMTFYMVATAWTTVWRTPGKVGRLEIGLALLGSTVAGAGLTFGVMAATAPNNMLDRYHPPLYFIFGSVALLLTAFDVRMIARGGVTGASRLTRHLLRMSLAMFMATASLFLGQPQVFPMALRHSGVLPVPVLLVVAALLYWLIRIRVWPRLRRIRAARATAATSTLGAA
jgi:hypothetical protein